MNNQNKTSQILLCILSVLTLLNSVIIFTVLLKVQNLQSSPPVVISEVTGSQSESTTVTPIDQNESEAPDETTEENADDTKNREEAKTSEKSTEKETEKMPEDDNSPYCYVTASGTKYHRDGCSYLKKSKTKLTVNQAKSSGYSPCSRCY